MKKMVLRMAWLFFMMHDMLSMKANRRMPHGAESRYMVWELKSARQELRENPYILHDVCKLGNYEKARLCIAAGADINALDLTAWSPLHAAIFFVQEDIAELLLSKGAFVDCQNNQGRTPLHIAISLAHESLIKKLLKHGASLGVRDTRGLTPLYSLASEKLARQLMSESFFAPGCRQTLNQTSKQLCSYTLKHFALSALFKYFSDFDEESVKNYIVPQMSILGPWSYEFIADQCSVALQRIIIVTWHEQQCTQNIKHLLNCHGDRHLACFQAVIAAKNNQQTTVKDWCQSVQKHELVAFFNQILQAKHLSDLPQELQEAITNTIHQKLGINTVMLGANKEREDIIEAPQESTI